MEKWLEVINREIREMQKHNKYLEKMIMQNEEKIRQNEEKIRQNNEEIKQNNVKIRQNDEKIRQNENFIRDQALRTEYFIVQMMRPWWKKLFGIPEKFELKR